MWPQPTYPPPPRPGRALLVLVLLLALGWWSLFGDQSPRALALAVRAAQGASQRGSGNALADLWPGVRPPGVYLPDTGHDPKPGGKAARAVRWALAQRGKPYHWGSSGPDAFDCSGLTSAAWRAAGVTIPRTAQSQLDGLPRVHGKPRPGDLVFYPSDGPSRRHVAMVVRPGRMVEARGEGSPVEVNPIRPGALGTVRPGGR